MRCSKFRRWSTSRNIYFPNGMTFFWDGEDVAVATTGLTTNLWRSSVNHLNFLLTPLDENRAEPSAVGRASGFSSIRTILRQYKFPAYATQQVSCNAFHQSTAIITTTSLTDSKK
jgi:hypothetical protein